MSQSDIETSSASRFTGRVKWFNNKSGYGFITASTGDIKGTDIFVHHSSIVVSDQQYKYLVQGEYVEFSLNELSSGKHKYQATDMIIDAGHGEGFAVGNIMKYAMRYGKKDNKQAELYKIIHYAIIALYLEEKNGRG